MHNLKSWPFRTQQRLLAVDNAWLRRLAYLGSMHSPELVLRMAPPLLGAMFWALQTRHRRGVCRNLQRIRGPRPRWIEQRDSMATFVAFAQTLTESFAASGPHAREIAFQLEGESYFREIAQKRKGCVLLTAHTSGFEMAAVGLKQTLGLQVLMAMEAERNPSARAISDAARKQAGLKVVHVGEDPLAVLALAGHLRRGGAVGVHLDRLPAGVRGVPVSLFGEPAALPLGPFLLARFTGAPLMPVFTRRVGYLRVKICAFCPVEVPRNASDQALERMAAPIAHEFEQWVREAPTQWFDWGLERGSFALSTAPHAAFARCGGQGPQPTARACALTLPTLRLVAIPR